MTGALFKNSKFSARFLYTSTDMPLACADHKCRGYHINDLETNGGNLNNTFTKSIGTP